MKSAYIHSSSYYFWMMDDDTMPINNSLELLISFFQKINDDFGFLCSNARWWKDNNPVNLPDVSTKDWNELLPDYNFIKVINATFVSFLLKEMLLKNLDCLFLKCLYLEMIQNILSEYSDTLIL